MPLRFKPTNRGVSRRALAAFSVLGTALASLSWSSNAHAQVKYEEVKYAEVPCSAVPVTGFAFQQCWQSDVWRNGLNTYIAYRLALATPDSEVFVGYGKPATSGFWNIVRESDLIKSFLNNRLFRKEPLKVSNVGELEKHGKDFFFTFDKKPFRCKAFVRPGPWKNASTLLGGYEYMSGGYFCRTSTSPIETQEVRFFTDKLTFR